MDMDQSDSNDDDNRTPSYLLGPVLNENMFVPPLIFSWGRDDLGGLFHNPSDLSQDGIFSYQNTSQSTFISISSNVYHSAALTSTGELYTTGDNSEGQVREYVANETKESIIMKPRMIDSFINHRISSVVCGLNHTVCVTSSGCALSFGGNECGQLGHSIGKISHVIPKVPSFQLSLRAAPMVIKKVSCGDLFTLFLTTAGEVYGCGCSLYLGNTSTSIDSKGNIQSSNICPAQRIEALVGVHVTEIASGSSHSFALSVSGDQLYGWGSNSQYQLGQDTTLAAVDSDSVYHNHHHQQIPMRITITSETSPNSNTYGRITGICAGSQHSILWTDKGYVLGSGANKYGQLGLPYPRVESFQIIPFENPCIMAACGSNHTLVLCSNENFAPSRNTKNNQHISLKSSDYNSNSNSIGEISTDNSNSNSASINSNAKTILYGFGANTNSQITQTDTSSAIRTPMNLNHILSACNNNNTAGKLLTVTEILYVAAGGDQSFIIATTSDGCSDQFPLRKQFSTIASKATLPMNSKSMLALLLKAKNESTATSSKQHNHSDESKDLSELLAERSFQNDSNKSEIIPTSSLHSILDVEGLEACYVALLQLGNNTTARLLAATQQAITEMEHSQIVPHSIIHSSQSTASSNLDSLLKVIFILWQSPLMSNTTLSTDLIGRLLRLANRHQGGVKEILPLYPSHLFATRILKPLQAHLSYHLRATGISSASSNTTVITKEDEIIQLICEFIQLLYEFNETESSSFIPSATSGRSQVVIGSNSNNSISSSSSVLSMEQFYNPEIELIDDHSILKEYIHWQQQIGNRCYSTNNSKKNVSSNESTVAAFNIFRYPCLLSLEVKRRVLILEAQMQQQYAQQQAMQVGLFSRAAVIQPWFALAVQREHLLQQTLIQILDASEQELKKPLKVIFIGEEGIDEGGVRKELFQLLIGQLFAEQYGMFLTAPSGRVMWINHCNQWCNEEFKLVGTLLALAVYNGVLLDIQLPSVFYKKLLQKKLQLNDLKSIDPELFQGLQLLLKHEPPEEVESFVVEWDQYGAKQEKELIPNGKNIAVTGDNRELYVEKYLEWFLRESIYEQFNSLLIGFHRIINMYSISHYTEKELELLMTGLPHLDFKELQAHTEYIGDSTWNADNFTIKSFWDIIHNLTLEDKQKFLLFVTGSKKAPIGGLKQLSLKIQRMGPESSSLPTAHTCFNTLLLPEYTSYEVMKGRIVKAINECEGFGLK